MKSAILLTSIIILLNACGAKPEVKRATVAEFSALRDVKKAPKKISEAAKAVVLIRSALSSGTGSFISADGLLLTNNHVVGLDNCGKDGCVVEIGRDFQIDKAVVVETVFAEPVFVSPELDVSILQLYKTNKKHQRQDEHLQTPDFLQFADDSTETLAEKDVFIVGHPHGHLKKFTKGKQAGTQGDWFFSSTYTLPGNSGSPFLDNDGKIAGILHRGSTGNDQIRKNGLNSFAVGSMAAAILREYDVNKMQLLGEDRLPLYFDTKTLKDPKDVVKNFEVYLNREEVFAETKLLKAAQDFPIAPAQAGNQERIALPELLGLSCDQAMEKAGSENNSDAVVESFEHCQAALHWLSCNKREKESPLDYCPTEAEQAAWLARFKKISKKIQTYNRSNALQWEVLAPSRFYKEGTEELSRRIAEDFSDYMDKKQPNLDPETAKLMARFMSFQRYQVTYQGQDLLEYVKNYKKIPGYELNLDDIAIAYTWLTPYGHRSFLKKLMKDSRISLGTKLHLEEMHYWRELAHK